MGTDIFSSRLAQTLEEEAKIVSMSDLSSI